MNETEIYRKALELLKARIELLNKFESQRL